jgi:hypothetical protein
LALTAQAHATAGEARDAKHLPDAGSDHGSILVHELSRATDADQKFAAGRKKFLGDQNRKRGADGAADCSLLSPS